MKFSLDASAMLRFLFYQAGGLRVQEILELASSGQVEAQISVVNWGEVGGRMDSVHRRAAAESLAGTLTLYGIQIVTSDEQRAQRAAFLKRDWGLSYADAIRVELALGDSQTIVATADFGFKKTEHLVITEVLPPNLPPPLPVQ